MLSPLTSHFEHLLPTHTLADDFASYFVKEIEIMEWKLLRLPSSDP